MTIKWTEIKSFHNVRKTLLHYPELLFEQSVVEYKCKVKLHGTNAAIRCYSDGRVIPQSRTQDISALNDNAGFASYVEINKSYWNLQNNMIFYGEWCGKGIQKNVAISKIDKKVFVVFAARVMDDENSLIVEPSVLESYVKNIPDTYVLPWHKHSVKFDWLADGETLKHIVDSINVEVNAIEKSDAWVKEVFGIDGLGEGLVYYPVSQAHTNYKSFTDLAFKAKGEEHKNISTAKPAQINPEKAQGIDKFVELVCTEARLEQGSSQVCSSYDMKHMSSFLKWMETDIIKECSDELEASGLTYKDVSKAISNYCRTWYIKKFKQL